MSGRGLVRKDLVQRLACSKCKGRLEVEAQEPVRDEISEGRLVCQACQTPYPIRGSIPRMVVEDSTVRDIQRSFGSQWRKRAEGRFEVETLWGLTREEEQRAFFEALDLRPEDLHDKWVLDAGCGSGRLTRGLASFPLEVVGLDVAPTIDLVAQGRTLPSNLHLVQGSVLQMPFLDNTFDIVWSSGVIHHTGDTPGAFANLARIVRPGGRLYVWVYSSRRLTLYKYIRDALRISPRIPSNALFYLCFAMAPPIKMYHVGKLILRRMRSISISPRDKSEARIRTIAFELHDDLSPRHQTRHAPDEVLGWFREGGFTDLAVQGEVGVRGIKKGPKVGASSETKL